MNEIITEGLLPVGATLQNGKYRIDRYIASGGFGNTYYATNTAFDEEVVIKELYIKGVCGRMDNSSEVSVSLRENRATFDAHREKFRKEARRLRRFDKHGHLVNVHDLFDENGTSYYVMDFIDGESLAARLKRTRRPMQEAEVWRILPGILDALKAIHSEQVWHMDLKPGNIMLTRAGEPVLIDFGASKQLHMGGNNSVSLSSGLAYTMGYAPSEQMEQKFDKFGPWTDLYSLGATLYKILTNGRLPSPGDISENPAAALPFPATVSARMQQLVLWLMQPLRPMRPQSVAQVETFLNSEPTVGGASTLFAPPPPPPSGDGTIGDITTEDNLIPASDIEIISELEVAPEPPVVEKKPKKPAGKPAAKGNTAKKLVAGVAAACVVAFGAACVVALGAAFLIYCNSGDTMDYTTTDDMESIVDDAVTKVTDMDMYVPDAPENMREFTYTGPISSVDSLPSGHGVAKFPAHGETSAMTYTGNFVDGKCTDDTGNATSVFANNDSYKGTFEDGNYVHGRYTMADGSYFEGDFKEGVPYNGSWYTKDGTKDAEVINGEEHVLAAQ